ncbi:TTC28 [Branchiostoma lanceolatum]|uniref:TTC28 protein n=1 Tax=Branchiostoma lanceolatum TaxID=7740 RepID=A0A8K0ECM1_BRALA|nr:TTC28 [Branchiostoma lanceolatum]
MSANKMTSLAKKLQDLELCHKSQHGQEVGYGRALREAILSKDCFMEVEILKSLGDVHLEKAKLSKDSAEFDKAAALYAAALLRCTDPDMGQTLEHRIGYMEKLSRQLLQGYTPQYQLSTNKTDVANNVLRVAEICDKLDQDVRKSRRSVEDIYTDALVTAVINNDMFLEIEVLKSLGDFYLMKGKKAQFSRAAAMYSEALIRCGDPETKLTLEHRRGRTSQLEEKHFSAALKKVHLRDPTAQQYQREVEPLCKLGDVYSKRGQQTGDGGDFVKAAALYNAAIARSEDQGLDGNIEVAIKEVNKLFLKCILGIQANLSPNITKTYKKQLKEMRDQIKLEMETIDQQLDPYVHDEDDPCVREIEAKRAQAVRQLFENIAQQRKEFISLLVEECIGLMGPPPCKYALIGLGSQATGLVTPYSDLEFAILVEEESEECLVYFRNLTHYLHLKVVNLGETILPALGIKSLNDFNSKNPFDDWYYDSVTPRGFAFDGSMPKASKTPLGRQGTLDKPPSELICTPENMVSKLEKDVTSYLKEGYHLATVLRNPCLIAGDQGLMGTYMTITVHKLQHDGGDIARKLTQETLKEDMMSNRREETITARLIDVKKEIYRFPAIAVNCLALSTDIVPTTVWETIEEMEKQQVISPNNAHHLTVLTSISAELRLRTYIANGEDWYKLGNYGKAISYHEQAHQMFRSFYGLATPHSDIAWSLTELASTWSGLGDYTKAISYYEQALQMYRILYSQSKAHPYIATLLNNLGGAWDHLGDYRKAIGYHEQALQMKMIIYGQSAAHPSIATSLNNLGSAFKDLGDYRKAIGYHEQALQIRRSIHGQTTEHPDIASSLNNLGSAFKSLGDYREAIRYHKQALKMKRSIYDQSKAHPEIAVSLNNLGEVCHNLGDYRNQIRYHEQALQMRKDIYGQTTAHCDTAISLNNLGKAWDNLGDYRKATNYYEQALEMFRSVYGPGTAHSYIATTLNNLGSAWNNLGDYSKAIIYHEQAIQMHRSIYGQSKEHPDIATSLNNLGSACNKLGDYRKAISYYVQALKIFRNIYGQNTAHRHIASSLNNLGSACDNLGDYKRAISFFEQALKMKRCIYGQGSAHPDIANSLNNLGMVWYNLGDCRKAISFCQEALAMARQLYSEHKSHPLIKATEANVAIMMSSKD